MTDKQNVLTRLRKMIVDGEVVPGEKLAEAPIAERLSVSRTPVRLAFRTLEQEGLLRKRDPRGYTVREFTPNDVHCALDVRGALEGIAARRLAQNGVAPEVKAELERCIRGGNDLLAKGHLTEADIDTWNQLNGRFHHTLIEASNSDPVAHALARNNHLPFASVDSLVIDIEQLDQEYLKLQFAHIQHQAILDALLSGEGARAEALMKEHAYVGLRYAHAFGIKSKLA